MVAPDNPYEVGSLSWQSFNATYTQNQQVAAAAPVYGYSNVNAGCSPNHPAYTTDNAAPWPPVDPCEIARLGWPCFPSDWRQGGWQPKGVPLCPDGTPMRDCPNVCPGMPVSFPTAFGLPQSYVNPTVPTAPAASAVLQYGNTAVAQDFSNAYMVGAVKQTNPNYVPNYTPVWVPPPVSPGGDLGVTPTSASSPKIATSPTGYSGATITQNAPPLSYGPVAPTTAAASTPAQLPANAGTAAASQAEKSTVAAPGIDSNTILIGVLGLIAVIALMRG